MNYPFRPYEVTPNPVYPFGIIYRPVIPVRLGVGNSPRLPFFALLDTGADDSKITTLQAARLGVSLNPIRPTLFGSATGLVQGGFGELTIELRQSPVSYIWKAQVAVFPPTTPTDPDDDTRIILGHTSFFRYFAVTFDFQRRRLRLRPNRLFGGLAR